MFNNSLVKEDNDLNYVSHSFEAAEQEMICSHWRNRECRKELRENHISALGKLMQNSWKVNYKEFTLTYLNLSLLL